MLLQELKKYLSDRQYAHAVNHGYTVIDNRVYVYLDAEKKKKFPVVKVKQSKRDRVIKAFRKAIEPQIKDFRRQNNKILKKGFFCPITGQYLRCWKQCHVDHVYPFSLLLKDFLGSGYTSMESIALNRQSDLKEPMLSRWQVFHREKAKLQILSIEGNIKKSNNLAL